MASGDVFKITLKMALGAVQCRPGFYLVEGTHAPVGTPTEDAAAAVITALGGTPLAGFIQNLTLEAVIAEDVQPGVTATTEDVIVPITGNIADDNPPPPQDCMLLRFKTGLRGTVGNFATSGRMYLPGIYSTGQVSGFLTGTLQTALQTFASLLDDVFVADGSEYQMHVVSFTPNSNPRTIRQINPVTSISLDNQVRSQRRRQAGVGI